MKQSQTNKLMLDIKEFLFAQGVFGWRQNTTGLFDVSKRRFRGAPKVGVSDSIYVLPLVPVDNIKKFKKPIGFFLGVEVKTGTDSLRPEQDGFIQNINRMGGEVIVAGSQPDFVNQYSDLLARIEKDYSLTIIHK
jgi:hypothetical protein